MRAWKRMEHAHRLQAFRDRQVDLVLPAILFFTAAVHLDSVLCLSMALLFVQTSRAEMALMRRTGRYFVTKATMMEARLIEHGHELRPDRQR